MADTPEELDTWVAELASELGIDVTEVPTGALLDLTRDVAHGVTRPAGPLTTFLVGMATARGTDIDAAIATAQSLVERRTA
ncbi:DUF6457 domain-containing protein [Paramicrobacterium agarici]|uniref:PH domain-containing protein n=1 Tax=Paramicrobacterium agarici TaxID=630514 RepID=A0A2A9DXB1_9MICO|nr:DUF6457 domain-containing protein [Microbacterium agarici]PFG30570.1 hypothetical protein ATJ78_1505 [Microbacterium agarici]